VPERKLPDTVQPSGPVLKDFLYIRILHELDSIPLAPHNPASPPLLARPTTTAPNNIITPSVPPHSAPCQVPTPPPLTPSPSQGIASFTGHLCKLFLISSPSTLRAFASIFTHRSSPRKLRADKHEVLPCRCGQVRGQDFRHCG